MHFFLTL